MYGGDDAGTVRLSPESFGDAVFVVDRGTVVIGVNTAATELLGGTRDRLVGRPLADVLPLSELDAGDPVEISLEPVVEDDLTVSSDGPVALEATASSARYVEWTASPTTGDGGTTAVVRVRDVTTEYERKRRRRRQQEALLQLSTDEALVSGTFEAAVRRITETAADVLGASRVNVWLFENEGHMRCVDLYDRRADRHDAGMVLSADDYPDYFEALGANRSIAADEALTDPRTAGLREDYLEPNDVRSLLDATLRDHGRAIGVVCHEQTGRAREWTDDEIQFSGNLADVVHRALRNQEQAERRETLEFRRSLLKAQQEAIPSGILVVDDEGDVVSYNERFAEMFGVAEATLEEGTDESVRSHLRAAVADPDAFAARMDYLYDHPEESGRDEVRFADGRVFERYSTPVVGADGTYFGRLWSYRDVTERRQRQQELELKDRAMDEAPVGITISDCAAPDNPLVYVNDHFEELTGYAEADTLGRNCRFLQGPNTDPDVVAEMREAIDDARPVAVELRNYRKNGSEFWNQVSIAPVEDADGEVANFVGFQEDITDRKEATRQLRVLHRVLRHNLTNQMTVIRGNAELLAGPADGEATAAAERITAAADRLLGVTERQRKVIRLLIERPDPRPLAVDAVLRPTAETLRAVGQSGSLEVEVDGSGTVMAIPGIGEAVSELVTNAFEHGCESGDGVRVRVEDEDGTVVVRVVDDGSGLPENEVRTLTGQQRVEQLSHSFGMGLWFVYWVVTLSRGTISVPSNGPDGTEVRVELPRAGAGGDD